MPLLCLGVPENNLFVHFAVIMILDMKIGFYNCNSNFAIHHGHAIEKRKTYIHKSKNFELIL